MDANLILVDRIANAAVGIGGTHAVKRWVKTSTTDWTAAVMSSLDLVIMADTAIAHLAGALGCRTWIALKYVPHWPWMLDREDSRRSLV